MGGDAVSEKRRTSVALVELRTVASRAETACGRIKGLPQQREQSRAFGRQIQARNPEAAAHYIGLTGPSADLAYDPEEPEMIAALEQVLALLERWR
jgi:hypothetical protein